MYRIGCDVDGVLANFTAGYTHKLEEVSGKKCLLPLGQQPAMWFWPLHYGFSPEDDKAAWKSIKEDPMFWATLPPTMEAPQACAALNNLYINGHEVYFLTDRSGIATHAQTMVALRLLGVELPQVLVSGDKGPIAKGLKLDFYLDDKPENCEDVASYTLFPAEEKPRCRVFCLTTNYNKNHEFSAVLNIVRVETLKEYFNAIAFEEVNAF